jgi:hemolysin activation/secretion protein
VLQVTESRPVQTVAGYANSGTVLTDRDRFFAGTVASLGFGAFASYQASGSKDFWGDGGHWFNAAEARYASHAGRLVVPVGVRSSIELLADTVRTNERPATAPLTRTDTREAFVLYRTALSNLSPVLMGDAIAGVELKRQQRDLVVAGVDIFQASADVFQYTLGWAGQWADDYGINTLDARVKSNPGDVLGGNTAAHWLVYTGGRVTDNRSTFGTVAYGRVTPLFYDTSLTTEFYGLLGGRALPDTERIAPGGAQVVRGYVIDDGAFDRAYILRNSLYFQNFALPAGNSVFAGALAPFAFGDIGTAHDAFTGQDARLASVGAGIDQAFGGFYRANLTAAYALRDGPFTDAGTWRLHARVVLTY